MKRTNNPTMKTWLLRISLHTFLCWSLSLWQVMPTAYADSTLEGAATTVNPGGSSTSTSTGSGSSGSLVKGDTSDSENGNVVRVEGSDIKATGRFLWANVGLIAVGLGAPSLIKQCPNAWSVRAYGVSAGLYIMNEIGLFTRFNSAINKEMVAYLNRGDEDKQIHALETAATQTEKAKEAAKRRAVIAKIAATGFLIASALAIAEKFQKLGFDKCIPMGTGYSPYMGAPKSFYVLNEKPNNLNYDLPSNEFSELEFAKSLEQELNNPRYRAHYSSTQRPKETFLQKPLNLLFPEVFAQEKVGTDSDAKVVTRKNGEKVITVNSVGAKLGALGIGAVAGAAIMNTYGSGTIGTAMKGIVESSTYRAVGFGTFGILAYGAATESEEAAKKLGERAAEYRRLADSLRNRVDQGIDTQTGNINQYIDQTVQDFGNNGPGIGNNTVCATGGAASGLNVDKDCSCSKTNSCAGPQIPDVTGIPKFSGSALLADGLNNLGQASKDLFNGNLKGATTNGKALSNNAAKITRLRKAMMDKINADSLKAGGKEIDFEKAERGLASAMDRQLDNAFKNLSQKELATLNNLRAGGFGQSNLDKESEEKTKEDLAEKTGVDTGKAVAADVNPNAGKANDKSNDGAVWDFNFEEDAAAKAQAEQEALAAALAEKEDQDYQVEGDINDDRNKNLFNIITRRYLKSAYPVIFEEQ